MHKTSSLRSPPLCTHSHVLQRFVQRGYRSQPRTRDWEGLEYHVCVFCPARKNQLGLLSELTRLPTPDFSAIRQQCVLFSSVRLFP